MNFINGTEQGEAFPISNIYAVGRNFASHAKELENQVPTTPLVFLKSTGSLGPSQGDLHFKLGPQESSPQFETELVLWIQSPGIFSTPKEALASIGGGVSVGFDFTKRSLQSELKKNGHPWTFAKNFHHSTVLAPISKWDPQLNQLNTLSFHSSSKETPLQSGSVEDMIFSPAEILIHLSKHFPLQMGDLIFCGTPEGVGPVKDEMKISAHLGDKTASEWVIHFI